MPHVALLGDSVLDNRSYTRGEPDVAAHLRDLLGRAWQVTLLAIDGSTTTDMGPQIDRIRKDATHLVLSVGGNDALLNAGLLDLPVRSTAETLDLFGACLGELESSYGNLLAALRVLDRELTVCTIYNGNLQAREAPRARVALMMFNDVIVRSALAAGADVIDLRAVCTTPADFANPIEPSGAGGRKIAEAIGAAVTGRSASVSRLRGASPARVP